MSRNRNHSADEWREIVNSCKASGLSVKKWCTENNVNGNTYKYWNSKLNKSDANKIQQTEVKIPVTEGKIVQPLKQNSFTICFKDFSVKIEKDFDRDTLAELLSVLRSVC